MGSNYPLKGCKGTYFEGDIRALAFANGGLISDKMRGTKSEGFIHIADWYTTFCMLAGVDPTDSGPGKFPVDRLNVWSIITRESTTTSHEEIMLGYNYSVSETGAIIMVVNQKEAGCDSLMWSPLDYPCHDGPYAHSIAIGLYMWVNCVILTASTTS